MTYDENEDYNGPDSTRRGPFLFMAALVGVILVAGFGAAVSEARADPTQTVLPADGVSSITRTGDAWTITLDSADADEVKMITPTQQVACSEHDGMPKNGYPLCDSTTYTFTVATDCITVQVDWTGNLHNSSDPVICIPGGTPSVLPTPTAPTPDPTGTPTPTSPTVPEPTPTTTTPATPEPSPSPTPTSSPTSTPETSPSQPAIVFTDTPPTTSPSTWEASPTSAPARLADTGTNIWGLGLVMLLSTALGLGAIGIGRRAS